jgi:6-phosphogluconolactonase (cycloisomerase 2 family)
VNEAPKYLYASFLGPAASIGIFSVDPTSGTPTQKSTYLLANPCICAPGEFELSPNGKFLFLGGSFLGGAVQAIGALGVDAETGALTAVPGSPFPADQIPYQLAVHPSGQFLFTENVVLTQELLVQSLSTFLVDASTGALSPSSGSPFLLPSNAARGTLAVHPSGKFLYLTSADAANGIRVWSIDGTSGKITVAPGSPYQVGLAIDNAAFDPTGKFLYGSGRETEGITGFDVDANSGALTPMPGSPFSPNSGLGAFTVDPSGRFLIVEDTTNQTLIEFAIESGTGMLTPSGGSVSLSANEPIINIVKAP